MVKSKRLTALLLSAVLIGSTVCTPVMAAEVPTGETAEISVNGEEQSEPAAEMASETVTEENSETAENEDAVSEATQEVAEPSQDNENVASENETVSKEQDAAAGSTEEKDSEEIALEQEVPETDAALTTEDDAEQSAFAAQEATAVAPVEQAVSEDVKLETEQPGNTSRETAEVINAGDEIVIPFTESNQTYYYMFIPDETGPYSIYIQSEGISGELEADGMHIGSFYNGNNTYESILEKGTVYRVSLYNYYSITTCTLGVKKLSLYAESGKSYYTTKVGNQVTLSVNVYGSDSLSYQWLDPEGKELVGENKAEYTFTPEEVGSFTYTCRVGDGTSYCDAPVRVYVWHTNSDRSSALPIALDEKVAIPSTSGEEFVYYSFTPEETDIYKMHLSEKNVYPELKIDSGNEPDIFYYDGGPGRPEYTGEFKAGVTYYIGLRKNYDYACNFIVEKAAIYVAAEKADYNVKVGEEATLSVISSGKKTPDYKWYNSDDEIISGANSSKYSFTPEQVGSYQFRCIASNPENEEDYKTLYFTVTANYGNTDFSSARSITLDSEEAVTYIENGRLYYVFVPEEAGAYKIYSNSDEYMNAEGTVYDENEDYITSFYSNGGPGSSGFEKTVLFEKGKKYYISIANNLQMTPFRFSITKTDLYAEAKDSYADGYIGEEIKLEVTAWAESEITYKWSKEGNVIPDATSKDLVFKAEELGDFTYTCEVTAGTSSIEIEFEVYTYNDIKAEAERTFFDVTPGEKITLEVKEGAYSLDGSALSYTWYNQNDDTIIEGANGRTLDIDVKNSCDYRCEVRAASGTTEYIYFYVLIDNQLVVYPEGAKEESNGTKENEVYFNPDESGEATLRVIAEMKDREGVVFDWYEYVKRTNPDSDYDFDYESIDNDSDTLTLKNPESTEFKCVVTDRFGNTRTAYFYKSSVSELIVYPEGAQKDSNGNWSSEVTRNVKSTDTLTLKVITEEADQNLSFSWDRRICGTYVGWPEELDSKSSSVTISDPKTGKYTCYVSDDSSNRYRGKTVTFNIVVNEGNNLSAYPEIDGQTNADRNKTVHTAAAASGTLTLNVIAGADDSSQLEYSWSKSDNLYSYWDELDKFKGQKSITVDQNDSNHMYRCVVSDQYANYETVYFEILKNNFTIGSENGQVTHTKGDTSNITVQKVRGKDLTLKTTAYGVDTSTVTYSWTWYNGYNSYSGVSKTDSCVVKSDVAGQRFRCYVKDGYGTTLTLNYTIKVIEEEDADSESKETGWRKISGKWYYFNASGAMQTGWQKISGKWYYFAADGVMQTGWQKITGKWYSFSAGGVMQTGWQKIAGKRYYFAAGGAMQTGWQKIGDKWYYFAAGGAMQTGWQKIGGKWFFFAAGGVMQTGFQTIGGNTFYFAAGGAMQTGWQKIDGKWYYLTAGGAMRTGWQKISGKWYYFAADGEMQTGLQKIGDITFYFAAGGAMQTGWQKIEGKWYYFSAGGAMVTERWIGNYYLTSSGEMAVSQWIGKYYVGTDGKWIPGYKAAD